MTKVMTVKEFLSREEWRTAIMQELSEREGLQTLVKQLCGERAKEKGVSITAVKTEYIETTLRYTDACRKHLVDYAKDFKDLATMGSSLAEYADITPFHMRRIEEELAEVRFPPAIRLRMARQPPHDESVRESIEGPPVTLCDGNQVSVTDLALSVQGLI
ncbi:unnamed protein product [Vitrella brassicaformis CCMP3155]|uniref:Uncharacterized protein n=2 Tax=Vitrella brassicaformis TaxID=1169539 RepID=A0A0G4FYD9_VITBC|nr:unnamed protein product [Vitrella brassicaformis CCMP3155]|mmetsp:Transcript_20032/g.48625  ORF Transcript_20032/g.48625 Transcript_20032/m.48625 type:complete len:160 (+) Transcript_20032:1024-1503(+)|eukprot:CEM20193.1 unnamed protein product [Vitrella brassicaformis CCMP3155]